MEGSVSGPRRTLFVASFMYMILSSLSESFSSGRGILNDNKQLTLTGGPTNALRCQMKFLCLFYEISEQVEG